MMTPAIDSYFLTHFADLFFFVFASQPNLRGLAGEYEGSTTPYSSSSEDLVAFDSDSEDYDLDHPEGVFAASTPFNDGRRQGERAANRLWTRMGGNCADAWGDFERRVRRDIRDRGWDGDGRNWRERSFNQGARAGMNDVVKEKERRCLHDDPSECIDLGNTAADMIAYDHCKVVRPMGIRNDYKRSCKKAAITRCGGAVYDKVRNMCGAPNTRVLNRLTNRCEKQVTDLIGGRMEEEEGSYSSAMAVDA